MAGPGGRRRAGGAASLAAALATLAAACTGSADGTPSAPAAPLPTASCPRGTPTDVECSHLTVAFGAVEAELLVARVRDPGGGSSDEPLLVLPADPARRAVEDLGRWRPLARALQRDVVVVDRRGAGASTPSLACPHVDPAAVAVPDPLGRAAYAAAVAACGRAVVAAGLDLAQAASIRAADDLELLRQRLGVDRWHVVVHGGPSPDVAALVARHPDAVASVTVDQAGVLPLVPGVRARAAALLDELRASPEAAAVWAAAEERAARGELWAAPAEPVDDLTGQPVTVGPGADGEALGEIDVLDADGLRAAAVLAVAAGRDAAALVAAAAEGSAEPAVAELRARAPAPSAWSGGVAHTLACSGPAAEALAAERAALPGWDGLFVAGADAGACAGWPAVRTGAPPVGEARGVAPVVVTGAAGELGVPPGGLVVPAGRDTAACVVAVVRAQAAGGAEPGDELCGTGPAARVAGGGDAGDEVDDGPLVLAAGGVVPPPVPADAPTSAAPVGPPSTAGGPAPPSSSRTTAPAAPTAPTGGGPPAPAPTTPAAGPPPPAGPELVVPDATAPPPSPQAPPPAAPPTTTRRPQPGPPTTRAPARPPTTRPSPPTTRPAAPATVAPPPTTPAPPPTTPAPPTAPTTAPPPSPPPPPPLPPPAPPTPTPPPGTAPTTPPLPPYLAREP